MADRTPALSDPAKRKLAVLWDTLRDKQKLTDEEVSVYDLGRQWLSGMLPKAPRGMNLGRLNIGHIEDRKLAARLLGLDPSIKVAEGRFRGVDWEYWSGWCSGAEPYETYAAWLETVKRETLAELESIWKGRSAVSDKWFEVICKPAIEKALTALIKGRIAQARDVEANRLDQKARTEAWTHAAGPSPGTNANGATGPKPDEPAENGAGPAVNTTYNGGTDRRAVLEPILQQKGYSKCKWATVAGVDPSVVYDYLKGTSNPNPESRKALAEAVGLSVDALPK